MPKSFIELSHQYNEIQGTLISVLEKLARHCSDFERWVKDADDIQNPFEISWFESYTSHWVDLEDQKLHLHLEYNDSYDEVLNSASNLVYPLHWVEHAYQDTLDEIKEEIKSEILKHHHEEINQGKSNIILQAKDLGIISEERAQEELAKLK